MNILGKLDKVNVANVVKFLEQCKNFDGGFGSVPGAESHAGQIFCCVAALAICDALHVVGCAKPGVWKVFALFVMRRWPFVFLMTSPPLY